MGSYKKRKDGRYATTVMLGYKPDGRPDKVFLSAKTEKELKKKVLEVQKKKDAGALIKESDMLLSEYTREWYKAYKAASRPLHNPGNRPPTALKDAQIGHTDADQRQPGTPAHL